MSFCLNPDEQLQTNDKRPGRGHHHFNIFPKERNRAYMNYTISIHNPFEAQEKIAEAAAPFVKNIRRGHRWRQVAATLLICCIASVAFLHFVVGWSHVSEHISSVKALFINGNETIRTVGLEVAAGTGAGLTPDTERVADVPTVLLDTAMWGAAIRNGDFIPDGVREEYEQAKKFDYSRLVPAGKRPTNEEAQAAIIASYGDEISRLLEQYKARIRLGRAYAAPHCKITIPAEKNLYA
jgi:hypothetical protein